jgi:hypothetical protein
MTTKELLNQLGDAAIGLSDGTVDAADIEPIVEIIRAKVAELNDTPEEQAKLAQLGAALKLAAVFA